MMQTIVLRDGDLQLTFDKSNGSLIKVIAGKWNLFDQPELGLSFRLMLPFGRRRNNQIYGNTQKLICKQKRTTRRFSSASASGILRPVCRP